MHYLLRVRQMCPNASVVLLEKNTKGLGGKVRSAGNATTGGVALFADACAAESTKMLLRSLGLKGQLSEPQAPLAIRHADALAGINLSDVVRDLRVWLCAMLDICEESMGLPKRTFLVPQQQEDNEPDHRSSSSSSRKSASYFPLAMPFLGKEGRKRIGQLVLKDYLAQLGIPGLLGFWTLFAYAHGYGNPEWVPAWHAMAWLDPPKTLTILRSLEEQIEKPRASLSPGNVVHVRGIDKVLQEAIVSRGDESCVRLGAEVIACDHDKRLVICANGESFGYERLVIAVDSPTVAAKLHPDSRARALLQSMKPEAFFVALISRKSEELSSAHPRVFPPFERGIGRAYDLSELRASSSAAPLTEPPAPCVSIDWNAFKPASVSVSPALRSDFFMFDMHSVPPAEARRRAELAHASIAAVKDTEFLENVHTEYNYRAPDPMKIHDGELTDAPCQHAASGVFLIGCLASHESIEGVLRFNEYSLKRWPIEPKASRAWRVVAPITFDHAAESYFRAFGVYRWAILESEQHQHYIGDRSLGLPYCPHLVRFNGRADAASYIERNGLSCSQCEYN